MSSLIGVDGRVFSTEAADRGMGRYVRSVIKNLHDAGLDICLILYKKSRIDERDPLFEYCSVIKNIDIDPNIIEDADVHFASYQLDKIAREQNWVIYFDATPFLPPARFDITVCAVVAIAYDLIPLRYPESYLNSSAGNDCYRNGIDRLRKADAIITISEYVKEHLVRYLGINREKIDVLYPDLSPDYIGLASHPALECARQGVFSILGAHKSKNTERALSIVGAISNGLNEPACVVAPTKPQLSEICRIAENKFPQIDFQCAISEDDKLKYQGSALLVAHLSIDEGFGIPLLEALFMGAKVVLIDNEMNREILGKGGAYEDIGFLVSPMTDVVNIDDLRAFVAKPLRPLYYDNMKQYFLNHWQNGPVILKSNCSKAEANFQLWKNKQQINLVTNTPINACGVADYSSAIPAGSKLAITVYTADSQVRKINAYPDVRIKSFKSFDLDAGRTHIVTIYNLAVSDSLGFGVQLLERFGKSTDIVIVHDLVYMLGLVYFYRVQGSMDEFYSRFFVDADRKIIEKVKKAVTDNLLSVAQFSDVEKEYSSVWLRKKGCKLISHSPLIKLSDCERGKINNDFVSCLNFVPMGIDDRANISKARSARIWRRSYGVLENDIVIGAFGSINELKYLAEIASGIVDGTAEAFDKGILERKVYFLLCGKVVDQSVFEEIRTIFKRGKILNRIIVANPASEDDFDMLLVAADVVVACRRQERGQMSHSLIRALSLGRPIVTNENSGFFLDSASIILNEQHIVEDVKMLVVELIRSPEFIKQYSREARLRYDKYHYIGDMVETFVKMGDQKK